MKNLLQKVELTTGHEQLKDFLDNASVSIHWVDENGIIVYANKAELDLLGYTAEEYIGHKISEFHADQPASEIIFSKLMNHEQLNNHEARLRCKDGSIREVLILSLIHISEPTRLGMIS